MISDQRDFVDKNVNLWQSSQLFWLTKPAGTTHWNWCAVNVDKLAAVSDQVMCQDLPIIESLKKKKSLILIDYFTSEYYKSETGIFIELSRWF